MRGAIHALAGGVGFWLLIDLLRVWTPSLITIFGQAASTPAELMGGFAFAVVLVGTLPLLVAALTPVPDGVVLAVVLVGALTCRVALQFVGGGTAQLWWGSLGTACAIGWTCLATRRLGDGLVRAYTVGLAIAAVTHAALGTWAAVWRNDVWGWSLLSVQAGLVAVALTTYGRRGSETPAPRGLAVVLLPSYLLVGVWAASPARASVAAETWGPVVVAAAAVVAVAIARSAAPGRLATGIAGLVLVAGTAATLLPAQASAWSLLAHATGLPALVVLLQALGHRPVGAGRWTPIGAAAAGAVLWIILFFAYYAGYDLGYRADWLLVVVALVLAAVATLGTPSPVSASTGQGSERRRAPRLVATGAVAIVAAAAAAVGPEVTIPSVAAPDGSDESFTVVAWNLRMGYGMDGTFRPSEVAELIASQDPDVVLLSEIDRAWLLNGGQDQLAVLASLLDLDAHFGPAADPVWGDAVLTRLPVTDVESHPLPSHGAVTGAQVLTMTVSHGDQDYEVASTHIQPQGAGSDEDGSLAQAKDIADLIRDPGSGEPIILGGDFNLEPGDPSWEALLAAGLRDALAPARPLPTSPADGPVHEIDHIFVSDGVATSDAHAAKTQLSDHLPVIVTLR